MTAKNACQICNLRPIGSGKGDSPDATGTMCNSCYTEGGWENSHNDNNHEGIQAKIDAKKRLTPNQKAETEIMANCWICHEELNEAKKPYAPRQGTSRAGIVIHVSIRATGATKAAETVLGYRPGTTTVCETQQEFADSGRCPSVIS